MMMEKYFRPVQPNRDSSGVSKPVAQDQQEKGYKHRQMVSPKPHHKKHHGHVAHEEQHPSVCCEIHRTHSSAEDNSFTHQHHDNYHQHNCERSDHANARYYHQKRFPERTGHHPVSATLSSSPTASSSSSSSSHSSSFSSWHSSSSSTSTSLLSSDTSAKYWNKHSLKKHSQSCTVIFQEEDDTTPFMCEEGHQTKLSVRKKENRGASPHPRLRTGTLKSEQRVTRGPGITRKAKSMEALPCRDEERNGQELESKSNETRKNLMKEKLKFTAFLNEITRQVLSPMRLTTLGVTDAHSSSDQAGERSMSSRTGSHLQQRSQPQCADSPASSHHNHARRPSCSSRRCLPGREKHTHHHHGSPHVQHSPTSCSDIRHSPEMSPSCRRHSWSLRFHSPVYHHHGDHHHHKEHRDPSYQLQHSSHHHGHSYSPTHHHGDHHSPGHHHGDQHNPPNQHGDHQNPPCQHHYGDPHNQDNHHHHGDHHNQDHQHHHGDHHNQDHHHHHGNHHRAGHPRGCHNVPIYHHHPGDKCHHHGDQQSLIHHHREHIPICHHHHGDHHMSIHHHENQQNLTHLYGEYHVHTNNHGDHQSPSHHGGDHSSTHNPEDDHSPGHHQEDGSESLDSVSPSKRSDREPNTEAVSETYRSGHSVSDLHQQHHISHQPPHGPTQSEARDGLLLSHQQKPPHGHSHHHGVCHSRLPSDRQLTSHNSIPGSSKRVTSSSSPDVDQTGYRGSASSSHKNKPEERDQILILQEQNVDVQHSLLQSAVRVECWGEEFTSSHKILETELQKTRLELHNLMQQFNILQENYSSTQQTNNLLEERLHSVAQVMEGERARLNRRISVLTKQLDSAKPDSVWTHNVASGLHDPCEPQFQADQTAPPPAQFTDLVADKAGQDAVLRSVPEEEESDWSEIGDETPRLMLTERGAFSAWRPEQRPWEGQADGDMDSKSGGEESSRPHPSRPVRIPHLQFTIQREVLAIPHSGAAEGRLRLCPAQRLGSPIRSRSASLEEIPKACHHTLEELRGTEAMMDLHRPPDEEEEEAARAADTENEIVRHWRTRKDGNTVADTLRVSRGSERDDSLPGLQSAQRMLNHFICELQPSLAGSQDKAGIQGWAGGFPKEVWTGERTQL